MTAIIKQYNNKTDSNGIKVTEASPVDDRLYLESEAIVIATAGVSEPIPGVMYDQMVVQARDTKRRFIWIESLHGLIPGGYTYPDFMDDVQGQNYGGKTYNFVLYDSTNKYTLTYNGVLTDLIIPPGELPAQVLEDRENAVITMKSSSVGYLDVEIPNRVYLHGDGGLWLSIVPLPELGEIFKITIS